MAVLLVFLPVAAQPASIQTEVEFQQRRVVEAGSLSHHFGAARLTGDASSQRVLARVTRRLGERIAVYIRAGGANLSIPQFDDFHAGHGVAYGGGVSLRLLSLTQPEPWQILTTADILLGQVSARAMSTDCLQHVDCRAGTTVPRAGDEEVAWTESTIVVGGRVRRGPLEPRFGLRFSWLTGRDRLTLLPDARFPIPEVLEADLRQEAVTGVFLGADLLLDPGERTVLSLEGRLFDVSAVMIGLRVNL